MNQVHKYIPFKLINWHFHIIYLQTICLLTLYYFPLQGRAVSDKWSIWISQFPSLKDQYFDINLLMVDIFQVQLHRKRRWRPDVCYASHVPTNGTLNKLFIEILIWLILRLNIKDMTRYSTRDKADSIWRILWV